MSQNGEREDRMDGASRMHGEMVSTYTNLIGIPERRYHLENLGV
jgi:hypothetical protein